MGPFLLPPMRLSEAARKKRGLQKWRLSPSLIATEPDPLHRLAKFLSGQGLLSLSLDGGFLIVRPPLHLLEQAILEHQLFERLERWLDLIVAHVDLHGSRHSSVLRREDPHFQGRFGKARATECRCVLPT